MGLYSSQFVFCGFARVLWANGNPVCAPTNGHSLGRKFIRNILCRGLLPFLRRSHFTVGSTYVHLPEDGCQRMLLVPFVPAWIDSTGRRPPVNIVVVRMSPWPLRCWSSTRSNGNRDGEQDYDRNRMKVGSVCYTEHQIEPHPPPTTYLGHYWTAATECSMTNSRECALTTVKCYL